MGEKSYTVTEWDDSTDPKPLPPRDPFFIGVGLSALSMGLVGSPYPLVRSKARAKPQNPKTSKQKAQKAARKAARRKP